MLYVAMESADDTHKESTSWCSSVAFTVYRNHKTVLVTLQKFFPARLRHWYCLWVSLAEDLISATFEKLTVAFFRSDGLRSV